MGVIYAAYGILFIIDGLYSMYITDKKDIPSKPCDIIPANTSFTCRQYIISDMTYCEENKLMTLFPDLYTRGDQDWPNWPAKVEDFEGIGSNISWSVTPDGNINYLKGFQVIQEGSDYESFGTTLCRVIDLSEMTKADRKLIMELNFILHNNDSGSYEVAIKPLPLRPENIPSGEVTGAIEPSKISTEYHPKINVSMEFVQINTSAVNISVYINGETEEVDQFEIMVTSEGRYIENVAKIFTLSQGSFIINGLKEVTYKVKLTPFDASATQNDRCICYFGTNESRVCGLCIGYTKTIQIQSMKDVITADDSMATVATAVLAPVVVLLLLAVIGLSVLYVWYKDKLPSFIDLPASWRRKTSSDNFTSVEDLAKQQTIRIIYTYDHSAHKSAVNSLSTLIQKTTKLQVIPSDTDQQITSNGSISSTDESVDSVDHGIFDDADVICIVHSEWAQKLVSVVGSGEFCAADLINKDDRIFLKCINELCQNQALISKVVSLRFEYSSESSFIKEPFTGPQFNLPLNTDAFIKHLNTRGNSHESIGVNLTDKLALFASINASFAYQNKHKSWLYSNMFYLRNAPTSDDSGIAMPRSRHLRSRSVRSRSADTISTRSFTCTCDISSRRTNCDFCCRKQLLRLRTYSCDLSFCPPESIMDAASERMSLLESKLIEINSRYRKAMDEADSNKEDCFTLDGQSV